MFLENLYLHNNQLMSVPESLGRLTSLKTLYLSGNQLTSVSESIGQLMALRELSLSGNRLTSLPESLGRLTALKLLFLYNNRLTNVPESLGQLMALELLDLSSNQLMSLPESLGRLTALELLYLSSNRLTSLPESLGRLTELRELSLLSNQLTGLSDSLSYLRKLEKLDLRGNPHLGIPNELLGDKKVQTIPSSSSSTKLFKEVWSLYFSEKKEITQQKTLTKPGEILDYYFRIRDSARPLNEAKLILVGRGRVGKTSLVKRLKTNQFNPREKETTGIEIENWEIPVSFPEAGNTKENVHLHLWDFGGQEFVHATHRFFLTGRSLYLLVLNGREGAGEPEALYWLELIQGAGEDSRVLVVLNRNKEHPFDVDRELLREKFPIIRGFIKTDCETGLGIEELKQSIIRETALLDGVHKSFPASWYRLKDRVSGMREAFLEFTQFRRLCAEFGIPEKDHDLLADVLNALGIALNFRKDAYLQSTQVLNPRWVTGGVYAMLYSKTVREAAGVVSLRELDDILDKKDYPKRMHGFLMRLMENFELCFQLSRDRFLLPDLLDKNQPDGVGEFKPEECLNFEYHYSILPEGLVPRFIVRTHEMSDRQPRWRTGVVCAYEGCKALIRADIQAKKIVIRIQGRENKRRFLLGIIRSHFDAIHQAVKLTADEMVPDRDNPNIVVAYKKLLRLEEKGIRETHELSGDEIVTVSVKQLLEGVRGVSNDSKPELIRQVSKLTDTQLTLLFGLLDVPLGFFPPDKNSVAERTAALFQWIDQHQSARLEELAKTLPEVTGRP